MKLYIDGDFIAEGTFEELKMVRIKEIIKTLENLEADGYCDKYVFQDWLEKVSKNNDKYFYLDEGPGIEFEIREE